MSSEFAYLNQEEVNTINSLKENCLAALHQMNERESCVFKELASMAKNSGVSIADERFSQEISQSKVDGFFANLRIGDNTFCVDYDLAQIDLEIHNPKFFWTPYGIIRCTIMIGSNGQTKFSYDHGSGGSNGEDSLETLAAQASAYSAVKAIGEQLKKSPQNLVCLVKSYVDALKEHRNLSVKHRELSDLNKSRERSEELSKIFRAFDDITSANINSLIRSGNYTAKVVIGTVDQGRGNFTMKKIEIEGYIDSSNRQRYEISIGSGDWKRTSRTKLEDLLQNAIFINNQPIEDISDITGDGNKSFRHQEVRTFSEMISLVEPLKKAS